MHIKLSSLSKPTKLMLAHLIRHVERHIKARLGSLSDTVTTSAGRCERKISHVDRNLLSVHWNERDYLRLNPSAARAVCAGIYSDGLAHWWAEQDVQKLHVLAPPSWDESSYLARHTDVLDNGHNLPRGFGYVHWLRFGAKEGRLLPSDMTRVVRLRYPLSEFEIKLMIERWSECRYLVLHPDVAEGIRIGHFISGLAHWKRYGSIQRRELPSLQWDEQGYLDLHPDVKLGVQNGNVQSGLSHYLRWGINEGRTTVKYPEPAWLVSEMQSLSEIEPQIYPNIALWTKIDRYEATVTVAAGSALCELFAAVGETFYTHVFVLPYIRRGGADLGALHHINMLVQEFDARVLVLTTEPLESTWAKRLPNGASHLNFGQICAAVPESEAIVALTRLLLKLQASVVHNINSAIMWKLLILHGTALRTTSRLFCSLFNFQTYAEGGRGGFPLYLEKTWHLFEAIFTDHQRFAVTLANIYGLDPALFCVAYFPTQIASNRAQGGYSPDTRPRVLWASRLVREKRPNMLAAIAQLMTHVDFCVYGEQDVLDANITEDIRRLESLDNVQMCGAFDGFENIPLINFALFLYTTETDGLPNIVLEALGAGLGVIAPDVGGIHEVMEQDNPLFVEGNADRRQFAVAVQWGLEHPQEVMDISKRQLINLRNRHSWASFRKTLEQREHYVGATPQNDE